jgi:hypothetical protein
MWVTGFNQHYDIYEIAVLGELLRASAAATEFFLSA